MGANFSLLTGRHHFHPHPDRNHDRGLNRTLQHLRICAAIFNLLFARDVCNLLTLCVDSWIDMPAARNVACDMLSRVCKRASVAHEAVHVRSNTEDLKLCNVTDCVKIPASGNHLKGGFQEGVASRLSVSTTTPPCRSHFQSGRIGPPTVNLAGLQV
jgi:hypothetical protein